MYCLSFVHRFFFTKGACFLFVAITIFSNLFAGMPMGPDHMPHFLWERISMEHQLPDRPISIGAATDLGNFIAIIKNKNRDEIYFLDHTHLNMGWQKTGVLEHETICSVQYGLGRFFIFGIDTNNHHSLVSSSSDNGHTWNQQEILDSTSHYDVAAFSSAQGLVTGREGAVAKTNDGITWKQIISPSGSKKKVFSLQHGSYDELGFVIAEASSQKRDGFFLIDDFAQKESLFSTDTTTWNKIDDMTNAFTAGSGEFLIYQGKGFAYHYPGIETGSDYAITPAEKRPPLFKALQANTAPQIEILDVVSCPLGQRRGWVYLGKDLKTEHSLIIYSGNRTFFVADTSPTAQDNPMIAISAMTLITSEKESKSENGLLAIASDGAAYIASTTLSF